jgi:uncharacterized protein
MSDRPNLNLPSLNLSRILRGGGDVSDHGEVDHLRVVTPSIHEGQPPEITDIQLAQPALWRASASHVATDEFYLSGRITGNAVMECSRCLEPTDVPFDARLEALLRYDARVKTPHLENEDDEEVLVFRDPSLDLSNLLAEAVSLELPLTVLHAPDCKGLCAACGTNLNHIPANTCAVNRADCPNVRHAHADDPDNPFAKLRGLLEN